MQKFTSAFFKLHCTDKSIHVPGRLAVQLGTPGDAVAIGGMSMSLAEPYYYCHNGLSQTFDTELVMDDIAHVFRCMMAPNIGVSRTKIADSIVFEDLASRDLTINFDYEGVPEAVPVGLKVLVQNQIGPRQAHTSNFFPGIPTIKMPTVRSATGEDLDKMAAIPAYHRHSAECAKTCGNCAHYGLLNLRCRKSNDPGERKCDNECNNGLFEKA